MHKVYKGSSVGGKAPRKLPPNSIDKNGEGKRRSLLYVTFNLIIIIDYKAYLAWCEIQKGRNQNTTWEDYCGYRRKEEKEKEEREKEKEKEDKNAKPNQ